VSVRYAGHSLRIARIVRRCLAEGASVEIDGLGVFQPSSGKPGFRFVARNRPRVFLAYAAEDLTTVRKLYSALATAGFDPWLDKKKLLPGQNWPRSIETAIENSDFFIACFSRRSTAKRGCFQSELRYALECANRVAFDEIYFLPVRFEECEVPPRIARHLQYVSLFPDWDEGVRALVQAMRDQIARRRRADGRSQ